jgi:hypothetical protein
MAQRKEGSALFFPLFAFGDAKAIPFQKLDGITIAMHFAVVLDIPQGLWQNTRTTHKTFGWWDQKVVYCFFAVDLHAQSTIQPRTMTPNQRWPHSNHDNKTTTCHKKTLQSALAAHEIPLSWSQATPTSRIPQPKHTQTDDK